MQKRLEHFWPQNAVLQNTYARIKTSNITSKTSSKLLLSTGKNTNKRDRKCSRTDAHVVCVDFDVDVDLDEQM